MLLHYNMRCFVYGVVVGEELPAFLAHFLDGEWRDSVHVGHKRGEIAGE